jgi:ribose/xylose/arabinose/galactoside ABC-type transport system permease subunit
MKIVIDTNKLGKDHIKGCMYVLAFIANVVCGFFAFYGVHKIIETSLIAWPLSLIVASITCMSISLFWDEQIKGYKGYKGDKG